jgi:hypothetical protein
LNALPETPLYVLRYMKGLDVACALWSLPRDLALLRKAIDPYPGLLGTDVDEAGCEFIVGPCDADVFDRGRGPISYAKEVGVLRTARYQAEGH